jgi:hypothetical protein
MKRDSSSIISINQLTMKGQEPFLASLLAEILSLVDSRAAMAGPAPHTGDGFCLSGAGGLGCSNA